MTSMAYTGLRGCVARVASDLVDDFGNVINGLTMCQYFDTPKTRVTVESYGGVSALEARTYFMYETTIDNLYIY